MSDDPATKELKKQTYELERGNRLFWFNTLFTFGGAVAGFAALVVTIYLLVG